MMVPESPADLPVAAPDPAATLNEQAHRLSGICSLRPFTPSEAEEAVNVLLAIPALLAERQQDKARIKWLEHEEQAWRKGTLEQTRRLGEAVAERQQDKERIERLTEVGKAAQIVADLNGESRSTYGRVVTHIEWVNAMFRLETAVVAARAALAVEEDAE